MNADRMSKPQQKRGKFKANKVSDFKTRRKQADASRLRLAQNHIKFIHPEDCPIQQSNIQKSFE
jgi:hypothetical protein